MFIKTWQTFNGDATSSAPWGHCSHLLLQGEDWSVSLSFCARNHIPPVTGFYFKPQSGVKPQSGFTMSFEYIFMSIFDPWSYSCKFCVICVRCYSIVMIFIVNLTTCPNHNALVTKNWRILGNDILLCHLYSYHAWAAEYWSRHLREPMVRAVGGVLVGGFDWNSKTPPLACCMFHPYRYPWMWKHDGKASASCSAQGSEVMWTCAVSSPCTYQYCFLSHITELMLCTLTAPWTESYAVMHGCAELYMKWTPMKMMYWRRPMNVP